ncbi:MAG: hypothetical protein HY927_12620 [Elusimicrobia bacterium]|nr:hypothetical protein [Elusimicrobiota bacterium]
MRPILVCPDDRGLFASLVGRDLVVRTGDIAAVPRLARVAAAHNRLCCAWCETGVPLSALELPAGIEAVPTALQVSEIGPLAEALPRIRRLKGSPVRVFLPSERAESYAQARVLASLGVHAGIWLTPGRIDWDRLDDLLHYAAYGKLERASIEPFEKALATYEPEERCDPMAVFFDDPCRYLHLAADGRVALSRQELEAGEFLGRVDAVEELLADPRYRRRANPYGESFLRFEGCSLCAAWRVCQGRHQADLPACRGFFENLLEAADMFKRKRAAKVALWRA